MPVIENIIVSAIYTTITAIVSIPNFSKVEKKWRPLQYNYIKGKRKSLCKRGGKNLHSHHARATSD